MASRKSEYKPLLFTTTIRNPERIKSLLSILNKYNNEILTNDLAEKIMGELIRYWLYRPMNKIPSVKYKREWSNFGEFGSVLLTDEEVDLMLKNNPQNHQEAWFSKWWASRFATIFDFTKELGFVYFWKNESIKFSEIGIKLANSINVQIKDTLIIITEEHPEFQQQAFLHSLAKYQRNNPFVRVLNENVPLILLLEVIKKINKDPDYRSTWISKFELPLVIFWKDNDSEKLYQEIKNIRKSYGYNPSPEVIIDICENKIMEGAFKKFKPKSIISEYPDEFIRKMRLTGLFSLRGGWRFIDINSKEENTVNYILEKYSNYPKFKDEKSYFTYMADTDTKLISLSNSTVNIEENNKQLEKWIQLYTFEKIKSELLILTKKQKSNDEIFKFLATPIRLEFLVSLAIKSKFPSLKIAPNYPCDDEGLPTSTAWGAWDQWDIECFHDSDGVLVEVTMAEGRTQTMMEVWPIARHFEKFNKKVNKAFCYLIAPTIFKDTERQIKFLKEEEWFSINSKTIESFIDYLETEDSTIFINT